MATQHRRAEKPGCTVLPLVDGGRKFETFAPKARQQARQAQVEPLLDAYWSWVEKLDPAPGSKLEDAVIYARNQKAFLNEFLRHGEADISNNIAENAIRPFVVGRKNWLFCDTPKGAEASAVVYTLNSRNTSL